MFQVRENYHIWARIKTVFPRQVRFWRELSLSNTILIYAENAKVTLLHVKVPSPVIRQKSQHEQHSSTFQIFFFRFPFILYREKNESVGACYVSPQPATNSISNLQSRIMMEGRRAAAAIGYPYGIFHDPAAAAYWLI